MKKMLLLLALMLCVPVLAETYDPDAIPVEIVQEADGQVSLETALQTTMDMLPAQPGAYQSRAELVKMSDGSHRWVVTVFDLTTLTTAWCAEIDASTGAALSFNTAYDGFFLAKWENWTAHKGLHALWPMEDKALYDALYALQPAYGLPLPDDMSAEDALAKALIALGMDSADGFSVGYGYLMGGDGYNGVWEITLVADGQVDCQVNLDAVTGEVYYLAKHQQVADEANG